VRRVAFTLFLILTIAVFNNVRVANSQTPPQCPYTTSSLSLPTCQTNPSPHPIPSPLGGGKITPANCSAVFDVAVASMYAYDDSLCYSNGRGPLAFNGNNLLQFVEDPINRLPPDYQDLARQKDFYATLYCEISTKLLVLAIRGSVSLTDLATSAGVADWINTNFLQHLSDRPIQYRAARDTADAVKRELDRGTFDGTCGQGRPKGLVITGHSKGGGQAQYAAVRETLAAFVFNSDVVNPLISQDWTASQHAQSIWQGMVQAGRRYASGMGCTVDFSNSDVQKFIRYYRTGMIYDVRMVNDFLAVFVLPYCQLPHADIKWLIDTLDCSEGPIVAHMMDTVVHELQACISACAAGQTVACP